MKRASVGLAALIAAVAIGLLIFSREDREPVSEKTEAPAAAAQAPAASTPSGPPRADPAGENRVESGETVVFSETDLAAGQPVVVYLLMPEPPPDVGALSVRLLSVDGRQLETEAVVAAGDRGAARLEFDAAFLSRSGRYLVELKTKEKTHFPLRRYVIEVR